MAPINQANDGHQGKVPTHCQVSLWRRQIDQVWSLCHLVSDCFLCPLLLQCLPVLVSLCLHNLALEYHPCILRGKRYTRLLCHHSQGQSGGRKVFEIQIESRRAAGQSIVGAGNMNLLEAPPLLRQAGPAGKGEPSLHSPLLHPNIFYSDHSYIRLVFLWDRLFRNNIFAFIHDFNPDFWPIRGPTTKQGV